MRLTGHNAQKTSFSSGSIIVKQIGHAVLTVGTNKPESERETYLITLPRLRIDGLWYGSPYIELADTSYIVGGGHITTIEFKGKGYFSGKSHTFKSTTVPLPGQGGAGPREIVVEGTWHENSKYLKGASGSFHQVHEQKEEVIPLEWSSELGEYETRRLWFLVAKGIREGDFEIASREKSRIEVITQLISSPLNLESDTLPEQNEQRQRRKDEQAEGTTWQLKHFEHVDNDPTCAFASYVFFFSFCFFLFKNLPVPLNDADYLFLLFHRHVRRLPQLTFLLFGSETYTYQPNKWTHRRTACNTLTIYNFHAPHHEYRRIPWTRSQARTRNRGYVRVQGELAFRVCRCGRYSCIRVEGEEIIRTRCHSSVSC